MFHYFKIPYITCTFLQNLSTMNILDPIFYCTVVSNFFASAPPPSHDGYVSAIAISPKTEHTIRATSHTRLRAHDHYTSSTLIGGKGGAGPSSLHTTLEGPSEYVNAYINILISIINIFTICMPDFGYSSQMDPNIYNVCVVGHEFKNGH